MSEEERENRTTKVPSWLGSSMRRWRKHSKKTIEQVADEIGTHKGHLSEVENGKGNLSVPLFILYCKAIGTPASKILRDGVLPKDRDVERLAHEVSERHTLKPLQWFSTLSKEEGRIALKAAADAVDLERLRKRDRIRHKRAEERVAAVHELTRKS